MAPTKEIKKKKKTYLKEIILFKHCKKGNFGFRFSDLTIDETKLVIWGVRKGQQGYFLPPEVKIHTIVSTMKF